MPDDLLAFLTARLDETEATARAASPGPWTGREQPNAYGDQWPAVLDARRGYVAGAQSYDVYDRHASEMEAEDVRHVAAHDPRAVLADVEAKRAIAALHTQAEIYGQVFDECVTCVDWNAQGDYESPPPHRWPCPTLRLLASCYRHHPGWRAEWAPETDDA